MTTAQTTNQTTHQTTLATKLPTPLELQRSGWIALRGWSGSRSREVLYGHNEPAWEMLFTRKGRLLRLYVSRIGNGILGMADVDGESVKI